MYIENNWLVADDVDYYDVPHKSSGRNVCDFLIMHFTGSYGTYSSSINWALDPASKVSWHLTIGRDGQIAQLADFRTITWHAGKSSWYSKKTGRDYKGMNRWGIGIEIANAGQLLKTANGYVTRLGNHRVDEEEIYFDDNGNAWESFTDAQIDTSFDVAMVLAKKYNMVDILGHSQIAPGRKTDPGPAYPLRDLRLQLRDQDWYKYK